MPGTGSSEACSLSTWETEVAGWELKASLDKTARTCSKTKTEESLLDKRHTKCKSLTSGKGKKKNKKLSKKKKCRARDTAQE